MTKLRSTAALGSAIVICRAWAVGGQFIDGPTFPLHTDLSETLRYLNRTNRRNIALRSAPSPSNSRPMICVKSIPPQTAPTISLKLETCGERELPVAGGRQTDSSEARIIDACIGRAL